MDIGNKVKEIRKARGYTQQDIADKLGVKKNTISQWESGVRNMSFEQIVQFAKVVGVTLDYFNDNTPERTLFQAMAQLESVFTSSNIPEADKDKAYQDIMKIYLRSKELYSDSSPKAQVEEVVPNAKEE